MSTLIDGYFPSLRMRLLDSDSLRGTRLFFSEETHGQLTGLSLIDRCLEPALSILSPLSLIMPKTVHHVKSYAKAWDSDKALKSTHKGPVGKYQLRAYLLVVLGYAVVAAWLTAMPTFARKTFDRRIRTILDTSHFDVFSVTSERHRLCSIPGKQRESFGSSQWNSSEDTRCSHKNTDAGNAKTKRSGIRVQQRIRTQCTDWCKYFLVYRRWRRHTLSLC